MEYRKNVSLKDGRTCVIRNGTEDDARAVLDVFIRTHGQTEFLTTYPGETVFTEEQEKDYLQKKTENSREAELVAELDGQIVGTAGIDLIRAAEKTKHRAAFGIGIDKSRWGLGIGRALTAGCIECARAAGFAQLELEVVADNVRAASLYQNAGFIEYGRNPRGFRTRDGRWQELILMRLELDRQNT